MLKNSFKVEQICRACTKSESELVSLYEKQNPPDELCYSDMIKECTMYSIHEDDTLPQFICIECVDKVRIAYYFKKQYEESQKKLLAMVVDSVKDIGREDDRSNKLEEKSKINKCSICSKEFIRMGHLKNHLKKFHRKVATLEIETCDEVIVKFETTDEIDEEGVSLFNMTPKPGSDTEESRFDADEESFRPHKADFDTSDSKNNLETITITTTKPGKIKKQTNLERRFQCEICSKSFKRNSHLKQHLLCHTKLKPYECPICKKKFSRTDNLKVHISNHGKKQFECETCYRTFGQAYLLKRHKEQTHGDEKPYLCSECGQRFVRNGDLAVHMRRHTGEKPYKCQYCNKGFTRSTEVYVHEKYHTGEKKHVCNICGKAFQRPYNLVVHVRTHTGERPYQCPHCPKSFAQCSDLKAHIRRHTGERYKCDKCSMGFIHVFVLNQHKRNVHGIDIPSRIIRIAKLNKETTSPPAIGESALKTGE